MILLRGLLPKTGPDQMHMRVIIEIAFMGVEDSMDTAASAQLWIAACKATDRLPGRFEQ